MGRVLCAYLGRKNRDGRKLTLLTVPNLVVSRKREAFGDHRVDLQVNVGSYIRLPLSLEFYVPLWAK